MMRVQISWCLFVLAAATVSAEAQAPTVWDSVAAVLAVPPAPAVGYHRFGLARRDLTIRVGDVAVATGLAVTGWIGFDGDGSHAMVMGDVIVTPSELPAVTREMVDQGIAIMAVHNHIVGETPQIFYVHFHADGQPLALARSLDRVLAKTGLPRPATPTAAVPVTIDTAMAFGALGKSGRAQGAVASLSFNLIPGEVRMGGTALLANMALATPVNLQQLGPTRLIATGDFTVLAAQVQSVIRALVKHGITPTAIHSHLVGESPTVSYIHFWVDGTPKDVLAGLRAGVDAAH